MAVGDASDVSGTTGLLSTTGVTNTSALFTTDKSMAQAATSAGVKKKTIILGVIVLLIVAAAGVIFVAGAFKSEVADPFVTEAGYVAPSDGGHDGNGDTSGDEPKPQTYAIPSHTTGATSSHATRAPPKRTTGAAPPTYTTGATAPDYTTRATTLSYTTGATASHYKTRATAPSYTTGATAPNYTTGATAPGYTTGATAPNYTTRATQKRTTGATPRRTTSAAPTKTTTPRPKQRILVCTTRFPGPRNDPPPKLCDIVLYDADKNDFTASQPDKVGFFVNFCKKGHAVCGVNIDQPAGVPQALGTPEGKKAIKDLYAAGIKSYGLLRCELWPKTSAYYLKPFVDLLKQLGTFMNLAGDHRDTLFFGVSVVLEGASTPTDHMIETLLDIVKSASINMVVYQTAYQKNDTSQRNCISTGPAMWTSPPLPSQSTFVNALILWKALRKYSLPGVEQMLTFTLCGYWATYDSGGKPEFGLLSGCQSSVMDYVEDYVCPEAPSAYQPPGRLLKESEQYVIASSKRIGGYDLTDTILQKMCMASVDYGYDGSWVVHSLQCHFAKYCGGQDAGGFPRVRAMKDSMQRVFQKCDYTG